MSALFGWCLTGHHASCRGVITVVGRRLTCACRRCDRRPKESR